MKSAYLLTAALLVSSLTSAIGDDDAAAKKKKGSHNPSGTWVWESDVGGNYIESQLKLHWRGKKLTGEYSDQNVSLDIDNGAFDGKTASFTLEFDVDGTEIKANVSVEADGDKMTGLTKLDLNGEEIDLPIDAKRHTGKRDVVGEWNMTIEMDSGESFEPLVTLMLEKGKLAGTYDDDIAGSHDLKEVGLKDNVLTFSIGGEAGDGTPFSAKFTGKPRGDRLRGKAEVDIAGNEFTASIRGKRTVEEKQEAAAE